MPVFALCVQFPGLVLVARVSRNRGEGKYRSIKSEIYFPTSGERFRGGRVMKKKSRPACPRNPRVQHANKSGGVGITTERKKKRQRIVLIDQAGVKSAGRIRFN